MYIKKNYAKNLEAQAFINQYKTITPIFVIDKKYLTEEQLKLLEQEPIEFDVVEPF